MRIKTKLTLNVVMVVLVIVSVTATSIIGMGFIKKKLVYLTERSTPFQIRSLELQKSLQAATADLARVSGANSIGEYRAMRVDYEKAFTEVEKAETAQGLLKGSRETETSSDLKKTADELFSITEGRLQAEEQTAAATKNLSVNKTCFSKCDYGSCHV
jgi:methyl-accepting chemotaxis protein